MSRKRTRRKIIKKRRKFRNRAVAAGTAAAISFGTGAGLYKAYAAGPGAHQLPVAKDADRDLLADREEFAIGYAVFRADQNRNGTPDGVELAMRCAAEVAQLPEYDPNSGPPPADEIYKISHVARGVEACDVCGAMINMGGCEIVNPRLNLRYPDPNDPLDEAFLPALALHYMEDGSFDCYGEIHRGRVNIARLLRVLELRYPNDANDHQLPLDYVVGSSAKMAPDSNDYDGDLLADSEELAVGLNLYNSDQDADLVPDGIELAMQFADAIEALPVYDPDSGLPVPDEPYKIEHLLRGLELCEVCGQSVNMGHQEVTNPKLGLSMDVYYIASHYMSHGSLSYSGVDFDPPHGPFHNGRINAALLAKILEMPYRCGHLGTMFLPGDYNQDCVENFKDFSDFAGKWLESTDPAEDGDGSSMMSYNIKPCNISKSAEPSPPEPLFSVRSEGPYILFEDMMRANCCPARLELNMTTEGNVIRLCEAEYFGEMACRCECDFPVDARLGPFEDGSYFIEVFKRVWDADSGELLWEEFKGFAEVTIGG